MIRWPRAQVELKCREDLQETLQQPHGLGSRQAASRSDQTSHSAQQCQAHHPQAAYRRCSGMARYASRPRGLHSERHVPLALRRGAWMCGPGSMDCGNLDSRDAPEPELVPMRAQAARHLRWLAPRLTAVRELALLDWVRPKP
jgi:hypothetical protein